MPSGSQQGRPTRTVTIADVARLAGVAPMTVSRVINNVKTVKPEIRERVLAAEAGSTVDAAR